MGIIEKALAISFGNLAISDVRSGNWQQVLSLVVSWVLILAGVVAFFYLIYSGFIYITAGGNADNAKKGQTGIINAVIGLVVIFLAYAIVQAVVSFLVTAGTP